MSSTSPLLQSWFVASYRGVFPYRLFALSNAGSVLLISGGLPKASVASQYVFKLYQNDQLADAAAVSTVLLLISVVVLALLGEVQRRAARRG